jgi:catechol 2,3-dioxygenase-like lactoylglutathione lyase family enzyme
VKSDCPCWHSGERHREKQKVLLRGTQTDWLSNDSRIWRHAESSRGERGFGESRRADLWQYQGEPNPASTHIAFQVDKRALVDAFYRAGIAAGGHDNGGPGLRPQSNPNYYGGFVLDPDGYNIEAVCREAE